MRKFIQNKLKDQKGLTLIELLAVIVILAIIAAIAIPAIMGVIENSRVGAIKSDATNIINAAELFNSDVEVSTTTSWVVTVEELKNLGFLEDAGSFDSVAATTSVTLASMEIDGTGTLSTLSVAFVDATKKDIAGVPNSQKDNVAKNGVTVNRP